MVDIAVKVLVIIIAIVIAVFLIADQIRCSKHLYDFRDWEVGDQGLCLFPNNGKHILVELVAIDFDKDRVVVQTVAEKKKYLLPSKYFLENVEPVRHEEDS